MADIKRPTPSDFDPFINEGEAFKVCADCYVIHPLESFRGIDGQLHGVCVFCDPAHAGDEAPIEGQRIDDGFQAMGA